MTNRYQLKRRTFLRGLGGAMLALPVLECMMDSHGIALAQGRPLPKRFGVFFWGNGVRLDRWVPSFTGSGYVLSPALAPLQPVKDYVNVITNYEIKAGGPRGHHNGVSGMLSGVEFIELPHASSSYSSKFGGPSIDNLLHADLGIPENKPVLNLRTMDEVVTGEGPTLQFLSHRGPDEPQPATRSPASVYDQLFGGFAEPDSTDPRNALRTSVLDLVKGDIERLQPRLSRHDRQRLDAHLTGVSELRSRILSLPPEITGSCFIPDPLTATAGSLREVNDLHADLIAMAFACDIRQITTVQFTGSVGFTVFPGMTGGHHDLTHQDIPEAQDNVHATTVQTMESFSSLMQKLKAMPEGAGNVLDNSLWLATSDAAEGLVHSIADYPIVLCGRAGGAMRFPGVHVRGPDLFGAGRKNTNDVLMTICRAMGSTRSSIGSGTARSWTVVSEVLS